MGGERGEGGVDLKERRETEPRDPRQDWDCNTGARIRVRINNRSWIQESSELVIMWAISDPENQIQDTHV